MTASPAIAATIKNATHIDSFRCAGWRAGERSRKGRATSSAARPPGMAAVPMNMSGPLKMPTS
ncbi:MAG: hypothetical protein MZV63_58505 [Marinilabiliales bacterium]|nr:hypothetical protein [Marinilabiliales bacterium]